MRAEDYFDRGRAIDPEFHALQSGAEPHAVLAENVNRLRNARGLTQEELAAAGMSQPRIAEIERGDANPKLQTLERLAAALKVQPWQLLAPALESVTGCADQGGAPHAGWNRSPAAFTAARGGGVLTHSVPQHRIR